MPRTPDDLQAGVSATIWTRSLWWTYAIAGALYILGEASGAEQDQAAGAIVVSLAVLASALPLVWGAATWGRVRAARRRIPLVVLYPVAVVATSLGAVVTVLGQRLLGDPEPITTSFVLDVLIVGPIWIILIGRGVALWQSDRVSRLALTRSLGELGALADSGVEAARVIRATVEQQIQETLEPSRRLNAPKDGKFDAQAWREISESLRTTAMQVMRPISHGLYSGSQNRRSRVWAPIAWLWRIVDGQDFNPALVSAVFAAGIVSANVEDYGLVAGLGLLVAEIITIYAVLGGANLLMRGRSHRAWIFIAAIVILQVIPLIPWPQILGETTPPNVGERIVTAIAGVLLILIASGVGLLRDATSQRRYRLESVVDQLQQIETREAAEVSYALRSLASRVHGTLQALLTATAMAIDEAVAEQRWDDARQALDHVTLVLRQGTWTADVGSASLAECLEEVCGPWRAVGDVVISLDPRCEHLSSPTITSVTRVVQEAVTNAFRHGSARSVFVQVHSAGAAVDVTVTDDGDGSVATVDHTPGLGTILIDSLTDGRWSREGGDEGTVVRARLRC